MPCMYDSWDLNYKFPFGAIRRRSDCNFTIYLPAGVTPDFPPVMVLFRTGFKERFLPMNANGEQDGCKCYTVTYSPKYAGVHYYYFAYTSNGVRHYIKRGTAHEAALDHGELYQLTVFAKHYETPNFLKGGIMYQIFPDRFCKSGKPHENVPTDRVLRDDWNGTPYYKPDANGHVWNNDYFGGDLEGIRSKLDYLEKLGVTCIYLNPIFESHENHRYNTANYRNVDPLLGTNEDFRILCEDAEKHGISIILDGVFSHTGADSIYFNKFGRYDTVGAWQSTDSPYYSWYTFFGDHQYEAWWGIDTLPNVVETNPDYLNYICGDGGVLDYWISLGAAGYRLDVADELPDGFLDALRKCVKKNGEEKIVIGEVWEDASNKESYGVKRRYLLGDQLDSVMNYPFREAIINYIKGMDANTFKDWIMGILENYPKQTVDVLMNFVSTHDIERAINRFGGQNCDDKSKDWMAENWLSDAEYKRGKQLLKAAMVLQFFLPGVPSIYYGDEVGLQGWKDPFNRRCFPWGNEDEDLLEYTRELGILRKSSSVFVDGELEFLLTGNELLVFSRFHRNSGESVILILNRSEQTQHFSLHSDVLKNYALSNVASGICNENELVLPAYSYAALFALRTVDRKVEEEEEDEAAKEDFDAKEDVTEDEYRDTYKDMD